MNQFKITVTREHQYAQHSETEPEPVDILFRRADCTEEHARQHFYQTLLPELNNRYNSGWKFKPIKGESGELIGTTTLLLAIEPVYGHKPVLFKER